MMGLIRPSTGEVRINDIDISNINNEKTLIKWRKAYHMYLNLYILVIHQ